MPAGSCRAVTGMTMAATPFRVDSSVDWEPRVSPAGRAQPGAIGLPTLRVEERPAACMQWLPVCLLREGRARNTTAARSSACCQFVRIRLRCASSRQAAPVANSPEGTFLRACQRTGPHLRCSTPYAKTPSTTFPKMLVRRKFRPSWWKVSFSWSRPRR